MYHKYHCELRNKILVFEEVLDIHIYIYTIKINYY